MKNTDMAKVTLIGSMSYRIATYPRGIVRNYGGGVRFGGKTASSLKIPTTAIVIGANDIVPGINELKSLGLNVYHIKRPVSNNFSNDYTTEKQIQRMRSAIKNPLISSEIKHIPEIRKSRGIMLFPMYHELDPSILTLCTPPQTVYLDAQGYTRKMMPIDKSGFHLIDQVDWGNIDKFRGRIDILKVSDEDLKNIKFNKNITSQQNKLKSLSKNGFKIVFLTRATKPTIIAQHGKIIAKIPSYKVPVVKEIAGPGEVFGVAFMDYYIETKDIVKSVAFGNACASLHVEQISYNFKRVEKRMWKIIKQSA